MNTRIKKSYRHRIREIFYRIKIHPYYQRIIMLPYSVRIGLSIFLFLFGIIGLFTPIPAGWVMILGAFVLVFGLRMVRRRSIKLFFLLRLHRVSEWVKWKKWW